MAGTEGRVRLKVYLEDDHGVAEILVSAATKCRDIVQRLQRQMHSNSCCLVEVWQGCERLVPENESLLGTLLDWGSDLGDVKFYLHVREQPRPVSQAISGAVNQRVNGFTEERPIPRDLLLGGNRMSISELREIAATQQHEIAAREKELKARQIQVTEMKRKAQAKPQNAYIQRLSAKTEEQQKRLNALRLVQDDVDSCRLANTALAEELENVRSLFLKKEKELAIAVAKVESLTQLLDEQRRGWSLPSPGGGKTQQQLELERLRKELMIRNELNHQQSVQIQSQKQLLAEKHKTLFELDVQIENYTEDKRKRERRKDAEENGSSSIRTNEQTFIDMDYANFASFQQRSANKVNGADLKTVGQNVSTRARNRNNRHLETLVEVEEEASDSRANGTSRTEELIRDPARPRTSPFEPEVGKAGKWKSRSSAVSSPGQKAFTEDVALSFKMLHSVANPAQRVEPEGIESPGSPPPLELFDLDSVGLENKHRLRREARSAINDVFTVPPLKATSFDQSVVNKRNDADQRKEPLVQSVQPELEYSPLHLDTSSGQPRYFKPSDGSSGSGHSSPSSLSSLSSISSNSSSSKAAIFAVTGVVNNTPKEKRLDQVHQEGSGSDFYQRGRLRLSKPKDPQSFQREVHYATGGKNDLEKLTLRQVKTEASPTRYERVGPPVRTARLDLSGSGAKPVKKSANRTNPTPLTRVASKAPTSTELTATASANKFETMRSSELPVLSSLLKSASPERGHLGNRPLPRETVDSSKTEKSQDASSNDTNSQECTPGTLSSSAVVDSKALVRKEKLYSPSESTNDTKEKTLLAENRYRETHVTKILTEVDRLETAPMASSSISVRGQSSVTKITVTPSPTFPSHNANIPEKRSPVPTSKRTRFMNREVSPVRDCFFGSELVDEKIHNDHKERNIKFEGEQNVRKQESSERETLHSSRADGATLNTILHEEQSSRPRRPETGKKSFREGGRQVVSSVSIQLASNNRKPLEDTQRTSASLEENDFYFPTDKTRVESENVASQEKGRGANESNKEKSPVRESELPLLHGTLQQAGIVSRSVKSATERDTPHFSSVSSIGYAARKSDDSRNGSNSAKQAEDRAVASLKAEQKFLFKEDDRVSACNVQVKNAGEFPVVIYESIVENKEAAASAALSAVSSIEDKGVNETSPLTAEEVKNLPTVAVESPRSTGQQSPAVSVGKMAPSSVEADTSKTSPAREVGPFEQTSTGSNSPAKRNQILSNDKITREVKSTAADESGQTNQAHAQKDEDKKKKARHVSLDPHAVLLDAAVEGELDLVKHVIQEVDDPSQPNSDGITALHNAVCAGHDDVVRFLVEYGCDINSPDSHGWTPLHCAAAANSAEMTRFLIEHGACVFATTFLEKKTPLQCCERGQPGYFSCMKYLHEIQQNFGILNDGRVCALYSYTATEDDELSFECGEELLVHKRGDTTEKEWWWAENWKGETGYIPRNLLGLHPRILPET